MEFSKIKNEIIESDFINEIKEIWDTHTWKVIVSFVLLLLIIATPLWDYIDGLVTTGTLVAVVINIYLNSKNKEIELEEISIYFNDKKLEISLARKDVSRSEISGLLGLIQKDSKERHNIDYMSTIPYLEQQF